MAAVDQQTRDGFLRALALLSEPHAGLVVTDLDGVIERWSRSAAAVLGRAPADAIGRTFADVAGLAEDRAELGDSVARARTGSLRAGQRSFLRADGTMGRLYGFACLVVDDQPLLVSAVVPAEQADGLPEGDIPDDMTPQWQAAAERALALVAAEEADGSLGALASFSRALGEATTLAEVLDRIASITAAASGAHVAVYLRSDTQPEVLMLAADSDMTTEQRRAYQRRDLADPQSPNAVAVRTGRPVWAESPDQIGARFASLTGGRSTLAALAALPLVSESEPIGSVALAYPHPRRFRERDRVFLTGLADLAAQAVARAQTRGRERHLVATLQRAVLPADLPHLPGTELVARYLPADDAAGVGGDWWDAFESPDGRLGLAVGDVGGHGLPAAGAMAKLRNALRAYLFAGYDPGEALGLVEALLEGAGRDLIATATAAVLDPATGVLTWSDAGHLPPLCITDGGASYLRSRQHQPLIGAGDGVARTTQQTQIPAGSILVFYTDGLVEGRRRDVDAGLALLHQVAHQLPTDDLNVLCDELIARVAISGDDICVLAVRHSG